jgi:hypothetical protein
VLFLQSILTKVCCPRDFDPGVLTLVFLKDTLKAKNPGAKNNAGVPDENSWELERYLAVFYVEQVA